jgi:diguanylate cyclase (GGDEF)-like protein
MNEIARSSTCVGEVKFLQGYDRVHLKIGSHALFLSSEQEEWGKVVGRLVAVAIEHQELPVVFSSRENFSKVTDILKESGYAASEFLKRKEMIFSSYGENSSDGFLQRVFPVLEGFVLDSHQLKKAGVRCILDLSSCSNDESLEKVLAFEKEACELLGSHEFPLTLICCYDLRKIEGNFTMKMLDLHPHAIFHSDDEEPPFLVRIATRLFKDSLTHLYNSRYLVERFQEELDRTRRYGGKFSILLSDVYRFRNINEKFGYVRGDRILVNLARILKEAVRKVDLVCRYGDDSFIFLLPETSKEGVKILMKRLNQAVKKIKMKDCQLELLFGSATFPDDGKTREALFDKTIKSLKKEKSQKSAEKLLTAI